MKIKRIKISIPEGKFKPEDSFNAIEELKKLPMKHAPCAGGAITLKTFQDVGPFRMIVNVACGECGQDETFFLSDFLHPVRLLLITGQTQKLRGMYRESRCNVILERA